MLLQYLLVELNRNNISFYLLMDKRMEYNGFSKLDDNLVTTINPSERERKKFYQKVKNNFEKVFCFANVPPPVSLKDKQVFILFHNVLLLSDFNGKLGYSLWERIVFYLKRTYIRYLNERSYLWIVQTPTMKKLLNIALGVSEKNILPIPFFENTHIEYCDNRQRECEFGFVYVADGVPQKNHAFLLEVWESLAKQITVIPNLHLTVPAHFAELCNRIERMIAKGLPIINHGVVSSGELLKIYQVNQCLIFPSLAESFGLPLIEAVQAGKLVLAIDLPYVYDVITPSAVFEVFNVTDAVNKVIQISNGSIVKKAELKATNQVYELLTLLN